MRILIDDERRLLPDESVPDIIATTFLAGELLLGIARDGDEIYIDHDLGDEDPKRTGYQLLTNYETFIAMRRQRAAYIKVPRKIVCVSSNPPGRDRINAVIASIQRIVGYDTTPPLEPAPVPTPKKKAKKKRVERLPARLAVERSPAPWRGGRPGEIKKQES